MADEINSMSVGKPATPSVTAWSTGGRPTRNLTPRTCVDQGGHCWERSPYVGMSSPPVYTEECKHCPASRTGRPREAMDWTYPDGQP